MPPQPIKRNVLGPLHATSMVYTGKPKIPVEIMTRVLEYLPVAELMKFARVSRKYREVVYDDTRWIRRLDAMGLWDEAEAKARWEEMIAQRKAATAGARSRVGRPDSMTIFDLGLEEKRIKEEEARRKAEQERRATMSAATLAGLNAAAAAAPDNKPRRPTISTAPVSLLAVFKDLVSIRGYARLEYAKIHGALAPLYFDLARARTHTDPILFRQFREPEQQAVMLAQLRTFARADWSDGWRERLERLDAMIGIFENAALREFEGGYEAQDIDGRMKRYAQVLIHLNGGAACIQLFVQKHPILFDRENLGNPADCFDNPGQGQFSLQPASEFFSRVLGVLNEQALVIDRVFPDTVDVMVPFLERVAEDVIGEYLTPVLDEAHQRDSDMYLKAVAGTFQQARQFADAIARTKGAGPEESYRKAIWEIMTRLYEPHIDLYLQEELDLFKKKAQAEVDVWEKKVSEADAATESMLMSNINREADKKDFLSSFKKVILMPVQAIPLPTFGKSSSAAAAAAAAAAPTTDEKTAEARMSTLTVQDGGDISRAATPSNPNRASTPLPVPTTELAAKTALMNSRLEGIKSLFSLEVALKLLHQAKESLERAALFAHMPGQTGDEAKEQCEAIFVALLQILGQSHIRSGFDKALEHLAAYNPRDASHHQLGVAPLVTFLELVSVGDLIQQMVDVFYEQELVAVKLTDKNDFLNPAVKEKKRFEQTLDERVAAGLNRGIDVLMDEVDYLLATTQQSTDFNPGLILGTGGSSGVGSPGSGAGVGGSASSSSTATNAFSAAFTNAFTPSASAAAAAEAEKRNSAIPRDFDIRPSPTAVRIVDVVSGHTALLTGSADKQMLDVFNQEVGVRLFSSLCKHIKRQRISVDGAVKLISDLNHYHAFITSLRLKPLLPYFNALRELSQIYLIDASHARQMASIIADTSRFHGIFRAEEVYEYAQRREDWFRVRKEVERAMYGFGLCAVM